MSTTGGVVHAHHGTGWRQLSCGIFLGLAAVLLGVAE